MNKTSCSFGLLFVIGITTGRQGLAKEASVSTSISKHSVQVAEPFTVETQITAPAGTRVNFPEVPTAFGELEVLGSKDTFDIPDQHDTALRKWTRQVTLESLVAGEHEISAQEFQTERDSKKEVLRTRRQQVQVTSVLENQVDPLSFRDIKSAVDAKMPEDVSHAWIVWLAGCAVTLGACIATVVTVATRKRWKTPRQWAAGELDQLQQDCATGSPRTKAVFTQIETIVKTYLEAQFSILATKQTTSQLLEEMAAVNGMSDLTKNLANLLKTADQVKYAGCELSSRELEKATCDTRELIYGLDHSSSLALAHSTGVPKKREEP
ncbi:MAG: DUF4381 family protein [Pirellulales bacterium]|nr:DUF4381 family protein [Pirellulales bacterium]